MYLILKNDVLLDAIAFAYWNSTHAWYRANALSITKVDDAGDGGASVKNSENESSEDSEETTGETQDSSLEMESLSEKE